MNTAGLLWAERTRTQVCPAGRLSRAADRPPAETDRAGPGRNDRRPQPRAPPFPSPSRFAPPPTTTAGTHQANNLNTMQRILDSVWIGDYHASQNIELLKTNKISHILAIRTPAIPSPWAPLPRTRPRSSQLTPGVILARSDFNVYVPCAADRRLPDPRGRHGPD